jgi:putative restriction endonuclease
VQNSLVRSYVGVTDAEWYRYLAARPGLREVNFWRPSGGGRFGALSVGEPFFFKTHYPGNRVVGGGFYSDFAPMTASEAWTLFGEGNGAPSLELMLARIGRYRRTAIAPGEDPVIGCVFIRDVCFFPPDESAPPPPDFAANIVQGKGYDLSREPAAAYFGDLIQRMLGHTVEIDLAGPWNRQGPVFGDPRLAPQRLGQQAFKARVLVAYDRRCAITGSKIRPVLQAAHIRPVTDGGEHRLDNGLLLRSDVHTLFDHGYLGVDPRYWLHVSPRLREEFGNGEQFYERARHPIALPPRRADRPSREFLEWHLDTIFRAS